MAKDKGTKGITVDMTGVDEGGSRLPAGDYVVKVEKAEVKPGSSGFQYISWTLVVISGEFKGKKLYHNTSLKPEALFNLRNLLIAIGVSVPKGKLTLNLKEYVGKVFGVYVEDGEYTKDGKTNKKSEVVEMYPVEKQGKKWVKALDEDEEDDDEDEDGDDEDDDEEEEDEEEEEEEDEDEEDDEDDDEEEEDEEDDDDIDIDDILDDEDEEEEEDEPAPKKGKGKKKEEEPKKAATKGKAKGKGKMKI